MTTDTAPGPDAEAGAPPRPLPLAGVVVLDLGQIYNGPYCGFLLAMAGAEVIKIEPPGGEHLRRRGTVGGGALPFAMLNSNKRCVTLNLKTEEGRGLLRQLVRRADVLLENFAPGTMDRLGVGFEALREVNPRLVYAQGSGYGLTGPNRDKPAMDLTVQAMTGVMSITGFPDRPPVKAGPALCDFLGGVHLYAALMTALFDRERTGQGRLVEVAMQEAVYPALSSSLGLWYSSGGGVPSRTGNMHGGLAECPYNVYPTSDGHIAIICVGETHWQSLLTAMGREELAAETRFATLKQRVDNMAEVDALVSAFTAGFTRDALHDLLVRHRVPCAPVRDLGEVVADAHMHARGALQWVEHPALGRVVLPHSPLRFEGSAALPIDPNGDIGRDTEAVMGGWLGLSAEELSQLKSRGVF
ncbi:CaiB/BaiF CoA-transferase family protein [Falsiroseomonas sp.]|uniref:CaiB/BaiF CoA transferase family protein n=1 Tax=Falsiroseomonas sp. TaxID=2870721 RepID=UPI0027180A86|nr:CoA transferase [Falsiroseomonas sp.]MDO9499298.1 CoA transferase [Falsiroseomonas sp.]